MNYNLLEEKSKFRENRERERYIYKKMATQKSTEAAAAAAAITLKPEIFHINQLFKWLISKMIACLNAAN